MNDDWINWVDVQRTSRLQPPRAPSHEDGVMMLELARDLIDVPRQVPVVVFGVTPEIIGLDWPGNVELLAVDANPAVVDAAWVPSEKVRSQVIVSAWDSMPIEPGSIDLIVGDCSFNALPDEGQYAAVAGECARVLRAGGQAILRFFASSYPCKTPREAIVDAQACPDGRLSNFRLDLAMAISGAHGFVTSREIKRVFYDLVPDRAAFAARAGAAVAEVERVIDMPAARFPDMRLNYFTTEQIARLVAPGLTIDAVQYPSYLMGHACPTIRLARQ